MRISVAKEDGGYVKSNGDIQIIFIDGGRRHGEAGKCLTSHAHSKACAQALLDVKPVVTPAVPADPGDAGSPADGIPPRPATPAVPEVLGPSIRELGLAWHAGEDAKAALPAVVPVDMPQKTKKSRDANGKLVDKQVDDGDLTQ